MNYELAKKLKDSGFPQNPNGRGYECFEPRGEFCDLIESEHIEKCDDWDCKRCKTPDVYPPTLSELIEACGDRFDELLKMTHNKNKTQRWLAQAYPCEECGYTGLLSGYGSTPEEAVAKLWLALNSIK